MAKTWFGVLILVACTFLSYWNIFLLSPLQPFVALDLGLTIGQAAQLTTASAGASIISLIVFGFLGSRVSRRLTIQLGMVSLTLGCVLLTLTDNYTLLLFIRLINGLSDGVIYPAALVLIGEYLNERDRPKGVVAILVGTGLAAVIGIPIIIWTMDRQDWQQSFQLFTIFSLSGIFLSMLLPKPATENTNPRGSGLTILLSNKHLRSIALANVFGDVAWFGAITFLGSFLIHEYQPSLNQLAWFYLSAGVAFVVGSSVAMSSDFLVQKKLAIVSSIVSAILVPIFFSYTHGLEVTLLIGIVYALFRAPGIATMDTMLLDAAENLTTRVVSGALSSIIAGTAIFIAAAIGGVVLDSTAYNIIGLIFGGSAIASVVLLWNLSGNT